MNAQLSFKPSLLERITLRLRWLECQLRCDWLRLVTPSERLESYTVHMQAITRSLLRTLRNSWEASSITWAATAYPEPVTLLTETNELTPALLFLHATLSLEMDHYKQVNQRIWNKIEREDRRTQSMLPSWEQRRLASKKSKRGADRLLNETGTIITDTLLKSGNILISFVLISIIAAMIAFLFTNQEVWLNAIAHQMAASGLPFEKAYAGFGVGLYVAASLVSLIILVILPSRTTTEDTHNFIVEMDDRIQERLDELAVDVDLIKADKEACAFNLAEFVNKEPSDVSR